ncbi:hypothetical protein DL766_003041 [Monosporascus sp. MC13-8B]|uniref:G domain-containing protein n=1 Tax=Monosporascus cannonballus TaxID=155416 RepID=A0ABY0H6X9_9PEZI|nr:hypothetical protein DL762_004706 [Monosporascus cannonballus]RYO98757.1 hypothetical protein DL763_002018 [Monosporascus cannonballus]RYP34392.1 hypothetical protein DL766_003041 [Monosporascus sp. MC13-8B]
MVTKQDPYYNSDGDYDIVSPGEGGKKTGSILEGIKTAYKNFTGTQDIAVVETKIGDRVVHFVDTPGFSDTYLSDTEVLELIADYLSAAYSKKMRLTGIIYLHPISDNRFTHQAVRNLEMFKKLTGQQNLKSVVLVTSMWDRVGDVEGGRREVQLREDFWRVLLTLGARTARFDGTPAGARDVAAGLLDNEPFYVQLQEEMGKGHKSLKDTAAGQEIMVELARLREKHERELAEMKELMLRTSAEENKAATAALEDHYKKMLKDMEKTLADERRMNSEAVKSLNERIEALEKRGKCCVM